MSDMTEAQAAEYVIGLCRFEIENPDMVAQILIGPATAFVTVSALQLATRDPDMSDAMRQTIAGVIDQMVALFAGTPAAELLGLGNDPALDIPRECQYPGGPHAPGCPPGDHAGFTGGAVMSAPEFDQAACTCDHPAAAHDDGFGCTEPVPPEGAACPCIAGWVWS